MGINANALIVPGHGTLFVADDSTPLPATPLTAFSLTGNPPAGWDNVGHTSKSNLPAFTRDGGDATVLDTFLADGVDTIYAGVNWGLTVNPLQVESDILNLGYNGWVDAADGGYVIPSTLSGQRKALVLFATDGTGSLLFYMPSTKITAGDAPSLDAANFFEIPLTASILAASASAIAPEPGTGRAGLIKILKSGMVPGIPVISSILPAGVGTAGSISILGSGFTGATGAAAVKIGGTNATSYTVVSDTRIDAVLPSGGAGSAPVLVTTPAGASNAFAYTRAA